MVFEELSEMMQQMLDGKRVWYITYSVTNWSYMQQLLSEKNKMRRRQATPLTDLRSWCLIIRLYYITLFKVYSVLKIELDRQMITKSM